MARFPHDMNKHRKKAPDDGTILLEKSQTDAELKILLAKHIQKVRKRRMTARKAAEGVGIKRTTLTQMETGRNHFSAVTLFRLASVLKCDIKELFPTVPESISFTESDAAEVAQENAQAAELLKRAFPKK
jgi:transcriptional regulator with XRE-family HTH domain